MTLNEFIDVAKRLDPSDKTAFCSLVAAGLQLTGLTLEEVASKFDTAPGTVSRWKNGHTAPAVFARKSIVRFFLQKAERMARGTSAPVRASVAAFFASKR